MNVPNLAAGVSYDKRNNKKPTFHTHAPVRAEPRLSAAHLHILSPRAARQLALHLELRELSEVVGVFDAPRTQTVSDGKRNIVLVADVEDVIPEAAALRHGFMKKTPHALCYGILSSCRVWSVTIMALLSDMATRVTTQTK